MQKSSKGCAERSTLPWACRSQTQGMSNPPCSQQGVVGLWLPAKSCTPCLIHKTTEITRTALEVVQLFLQAAGKVFKELQ